MCTCEFCVAKVVQCDIIAEVMYTCTLVYTIHVHVCTYMYVHVHVCILGCNLIGPLVLSLAERRLFSGCS